VGFFEPEKSLMAGQRVVPRPDASDAARAHLVPLKDKILGDTDRAMSGLLETIVEDEILEFLGESVRMGTLGARKLVQQPLGPIGLEISADLIELLS